MDETGLNNRKPRISSFKRPKQKDHLFSYYPGNLNITCTYGAKMSCLLAANNVVKAK